MPEQSIEVPQVFHLPDLGEGLTAAEIVRWLVEPGRAVQADEPVVEVETAKAAVEIPAPYAGIVLACHGSPGETLNVGDPLISIGTDDEAPQVLVGTGPAPTHGQRRRKRVTKLPPPQPDPKRSRLTGAALAMAENVTRSHRDLPTATTWVEADATDFLRMRATLRTGSTGRPPSLLAMFARLCVRGLLRQPELNASMADNGVDVIHSDWIHLGVIVQARSGLIVPVVRDAGTRRLDDLDAELARLIAAARDGTLQPQQCSGGTFTLNNYGTYGVDGATPLLHHPQGAMLGVGRISAKPWVFEDAVVPRHVLQLALTFDHRLCDGRTAASFLRHVADAVEQPESCFGRRHC